MQHRERYNHQFKRKCLFCKQVSEDRKAYFQHMFDIHGFNIGLPDNLVNVHTLLDILDAKIREYVIYLNQQSRNVCIYCERIFKDYSVLKLHMRKKKHFKINARNKDYDKFYIINYLV